MSTPFNPDWLNPGAAVEVSIDTIAAYHSEVLRLRAALAEPVQETDLSRCPQCGGPADNGHDRSIPPSPYFCTKCVAEPATLDEAMAAPLSLAKAYENGWNAAKAEQGEPVAFPEGYEPHELPADYTGPLWIEGQVRRLYESATPPQRKPLTDETLWEMWVESPSDVLRFARAIERAHGIGA